MVNSSLSVSVFCICAAIFSVLLRQYCREQSLMLALAACIIVVGGLLTVIQPVISGLQELFTEAGISSDYISLIFKSAAICFITQITCEICRDSGENAIASAAELWGRGAIMAMALPVTKSLLEMLTNYL